MSTKIPRVTLVGAGPGDVDLLTIKGAKALAAADLVLYDALINPALLDLVPADKPRVFVGKRSGKHEFPQEEINALIVKYAFEYGHVVRLKGGDPFVFGRGYEEIQFAAQHGISTAVIPGISSAVAVPASQNIPLTSRGVSESFWVITGATKYGQISEDIALAAQSSATVIILMGMKNLEDITRVFQVLGKNTTPVAIIQNGTLPNERLVCGTIDTIYQLAQEQQVTSPAIIVIGQVVDLRFPSEQKTKIIQEANQFNLPNGSTF
ncbi:uroporphyrinogen-III C-methyltransferase [Adhaeribacter pallidiroseus]|uniref:uroporphyrinogen-III C-methyltransferase n=1 Tax=Adhaeribacter pallidiroseus TaxID=2072847 RepID=A0A369QFY6_9BACT|nr:uroporphyrinogen-III C-methyltransferase [Adhaeribacter pallidiroseus]RDC63342.1 Uroporphyrinogen-III C-methyltransferase [Adhaeribacter pallidiroseus]